MGALSEKDDYRRHEAYLHKCLTPALVQLMLELDLTMFNNKTP